jgi:hypothetical protein
MGLFCNLMRTNCVELINAAVESTQLSRLSPQNLQYLQKPVENGKLA